MADIYTYLISLLIVCSNIQMTSSACDLEKGCFPSIVDILKNLQSFPARSLSVSSTCGENGAEQYMTYLGSDFIIYDCNPSAVADTNIVDEDSSKYWQSSIGNGPEFVEVRFTDVFLVYEMLISFAVPHLADPDKSADARPPAWTVEKLDADNVTWVPLRHFAKDCATSFPGIPLLDPFASNDYNVLFCEQYDEVDDTVDFFDADNLVVYYPGILDVYSPFAFRNDPAVANYFSTTAVRLSFVDLNRVLAQQKYVAISKIVLDVRCQCNGHAELCSGPNQATCDCQHFTTGQYCDSCLPLYNNQSWTHGNVNDAGACQVCSCNKHATSCVYNQPKTYGVCQSCEDNTAGDFCDTCATGFYINSTWASANDTSKGGDYCLPCNCNEAGTLPDQLNTCDVATGQCSCKTNVQGRDCSECKDTFHGLAADNADGCQACECNPSGSIGDNSMCNKTDGACLCRANVQGVSCNDCKTNTYGFDAANADGCVPCACDPGGAVGQSCDVASGQCTCRTSISSRDCKVPNGGNFVPRLDLIILEPERSSSEGVVLRAGHGTEGVAVSGRGLVSITSANKIEISFTAGYGGLMDMAVRYEKTTDSNLVFLQATLSLTSTQSYSCGDIPISAGKTWTLTKTDTHEGKTGTVDLGQACLGKDSSYTLELSNSGSALQVDSIVFVPDKETLKTPVSGLVNSEDVDSCYQNALDKVRPDREACKGLEYSLMAAYLNGAQACTCSGGSIVSPSCDLYSGDCNCNTGVLPPDCDVCRVEYYQFSTQTGCIACQCHVNGSMNTFCDNLGGCDCHPNVVGNKCNSCTTDHFGLYTGKGCTPCQCDETYSLGTGCDDYGQCDCKPGVGGTNCDRCAHGNYNLTPEGCTSCGCNPKGSTGVGCDEKTGVCQCRDNVEGSSCNDCKTGYFGLGDWHTGGCIPCFCWGKGDNCTSAPDMYDNPVRTTSIAWPDGWTAANATGGPVNIALDGSGAEQKLKLSTVDDSEADLYFVAPTKYLGDRSSSYGRSLSLVISSTTLPLSDGATPSSATTSTMDVILEGTYASVAILYSATVQLGGAQTFSISVSENSWNAIDKSSLQQPRDQSASLPKASFTQMMQVLTYVSALRMQAYNTKTPGHTLMIHSLTLQAASNGPSTSVVVNNVEMCQCHDGYSGKHCEVCDTSYTRSTPNNQDPSTECVTCSCNGHSQQNCNRDTGVCTEVPCDPVSGVCVCIHNTEGDNCQTCKTGYYGDPTKGTPDDCLPCACPGIIVNNDVNVFATSCETNNEGVPVCANCTKGHTGDHCEICQDGFYGTPENATNAGGTCQSCVCNGRADTCDPRTGMCVDCRNNTSGQQCDICATKYFGDAMTFSCEECVCKNYPGSTGECNPSSGQCECLPNVVGNLCDQCRDTTFNLQPLIGCELCNCHENGSTSAVCIKTTGQCPCRDLVEGRQCNQCQDSFWNINTDTGCDPCSCNQLGTAKNGSEIIPTCDVESGQCQCALPGTTGRTCDACSPVTTYQFDFVKLFYLGSFPQCELCGECFDSWGVIIDDIGKETKGLDDTTKDIWQQYDNQTPEQIGASLSVTEEKIEKASESIGSFESMAQDLVHLQVRFGQAITKDGVLSSRAGLLSDRETSLRTQLSTLEALTELIRLTESTTTTVTALQQNMNTLMSSTQASINKGTSSWDAIETLKFVVADPADRERQLRSQADASMQIAKLANQTFQLADILYKNNLKSGSEDNAEELRVSAQQQTDASGKLTSVQSTATQVTTSIDDVRTTLTSLVGAAEKSRTDTLKMVDDLQNYVTNASSAQRNVEDAQEMADKFMKEAKQAETTMRNSMSTILENLAALTEAQSDLVSSQLESTGVLSVSVRPLSELETIMADISSISISSSDIQAVDLKAQKALVLAEEALQDTQKALGLARDVNQEVVIMEEDIQTSQNLRTEAQGLKNAADMVNNVINTIVSDAENYINKTEADIALVTSSSQEVLSNVTTIATCLDQGQIKVNDAKTSASRAEQRAQTTSENQQVLLQLMLDINAESGDQTVSQALNSLTQGSSLLTQVVSDRTEVEALTDLQVLVQDLVNQVQEINTLESEINALTSELDDLVLSLEENLDGGSCNV